MESERVPHVIFLPFPVQGHVKPLLTLAKLFSHVAGFQVTFINTHHNQDCFHRFNDMASFSTQFPNFQFMSVSDGLPSDHPRSPELAADLISSIGSVTKQEVHHLLINIGKENRPPASCIIADGIMSFAVDIGKEIGIPVIAFRTFSASCLWIYFHLPKLCKEGLIPLQAESDMDEAITCISGLEKVLRGRDLPGICRWTKRSDQILKFFIGQAEAMTRASALILNTFDGIEAPMISNLTSFFSNIYSVGPLHGLVDNFIEESSSTSTSFNANLNKEDETCIKWLDSQNPRSVIYVSFGSLIVISHNQLLEFWHGLVNSGQTFLWVVRPDLLVGDDDAHQVPLELEIATKERGYIVGWAPQVEVLSHPAIGGFLTHSGWNSTMESILAGVPMICWPSIGDQQVNSRLISELWRIGFDMKDTCDRVTIEKMVKDLMENRREEITKSMDEIAKMANESVKEGGSSYRNLVKLIEDIRSMS